MIDWNKVNRLIDERDYKRIELIHAPNLDEESAIKAEIKNIDKKLEKVLGKKEYSRLEEVKNKNGRKEKQIIDEYYEFKEKESKINPLSTATKEMVKKAMKRREKEQATNFVVIEHDEKSKELTKVS